MGAGRGEGREEVEDVGGGASASAPSAGSPSAREGQREGGRDPDRQPCPARGRSAPRPALQPALQLGRGRCKGPGPGAALGLPLGSGEQTPGGGRWCAWPVLSRLSPSQGDRDDRSYKQCRTSSPSSTGSVSLGRYTPTSRSPQHYSRPGTCPRGSFYPCEAALLAAFPLRVCVLLYAAGKTTDRVWGCRGGGELLS